MPQSGYGDIPKRVVPRKFVLSSLAFKKPEMGAFFYAPPANLESRVGRNENETGIFNTGLS